MNCSMSGLQIMIHSRLEMYQNQLFPNNWHHLELSMKAETPQTVSPIHLFPEENVLDLSTKKGSTSQTELDRNHNERLQSPDYRPSSTNSSPNSRDSCESPQRMRYTPDSLANYVFPYSIPHQRGKVSRPFKAFPKTPLPITYNLPNVDANLNYQSDEAYIRFRNEMLSQLQTQNNGTNKNMRRNSSSSQNHHNDDPTYWEKRKKNNEAAKRSRDARRAKEDEIAIRCAFLENENRNLKAKLHALEEHIDRLLK